jgi:imidazole glycerol-phosphate synthase subunit HisH
MTAPEVVVIDYGVGNLLSVRRGLEYCGARVTLTSEPERILAADRIVLPGVGAFANAMQTLWRLELVPVIREIGRRERALLCICLGMQLLLDESEEFGITEGLKLIPGRVIPVPSTTVAGAKQKIPHIGWNALQPSGASDGWRGTLLEDNTPGESAYFVHSFMAVPNDPKDRIADTLYGGHAVPAAIGRGRITGFQFHPEKSGKVGLKILRRFVQQ